VVDGRRGGKLPFYGPSPWRSGDGAQGHLEEGSVDRCGGIGTWHSSGWHRDASATWLQPWWHVQKRRSATAVRRWQSCAAQCKHGAKDDGVKRLDRKDRDFEVNDKRWGIRHLGMRFIEEKLTKDFCLSIACLNLDSFNLEEMCKRIMDR
jgi:hypothetical protein